MLENQEQMKWTLVPLNLLRISFSYQHPSADTGAAGRFHISDANHFTSFKVTAGTDRSKESYGKYGFDVARTARNPQRGGAVILPRLRCGLGPTQASEAPAGRSDVPRQMAAAETSLRPKENHRFLVKGRRSAQHL